MEQKKNYMIKLNVIQYMYVVAKSQMVISYNLHDIKWEPSWYNAKNLFLSKNAYTELK